MVPPVPVERICLTLAAFSVLLSGKKGPGMLRRLYDWTIGLAQSPYAMWGLALVAFLESSVFPIPPDILMIPMIIAMPRKAFLIAGVALVSSVAGGMLGYYIGWGLFESIGRPVLEFYGKDTYFDEFAVRYNEWGAWMVLMAGVTPFPYKVITILSGSTGLNFGVFMISSIIARGLRFFVVAGLLWKFGEPIRDFIEKRLGLMFVLLVVLLLAGFYVVKFI
jgi:membrane protein YqaA with SNARE-associated domain